MIQRKQSLFLLISAILMASSVFVPFMQFASSTGSVYINAFEIVNYESDILEQSASIKTLGITIIIIAIVNIISIFLFSKRPLQIRVVRYAILLKCAIFAVLFYYTYLLSASDTTFTIIPKTGVLALVIALILDWIAIRNIKKDEELVKSIDRIR